MSVRISSVAFEAEISSLPDTLYARKGETGGGGVKFSDFGYETPGEAVYRVIGLKIGEIRPAAGATVVFGLDHRDRRDVMLKNDAFVMRGPGHEGSGAWDGGYRGRFLTLAPNVIERLLRTPLSQIAIEPFVSDLADRRGIHHLLAALSEDGPEIGLDDDLLLLESVALAVMRAAGIRSRETTRKVPTLSQAQAAVLYDLIASRLTEPLSLGEMATAVGLSESYFVRAFTGSFGVSPYRYVLRERVSLAQSLIQSGGLSLAEVAARSGFPGANRMSRTFRQTTGRSPTGVVKPRRRKPG